MARADQRGEQHPEREIQHLLALSLPLRAGPLTFRQLCGKRDRGDESTRQKQTIGVKRNAFASFSQESTGGKHIVKAKQRDRDSDGRKKQRTVELIFAMGRIELTGLRIEGAMRPTPP